MSASGALQEGTIVFDTYRVTKLIAEGGFGSVWRADHVRLPGKRVAIKVLQRDIANDEETLLRFRREAEIASRLGHPNIVEVHDFNMLPDGSPYLVLEFLYGESLRQVVAKGPMDFKRVCRIFRQVGSALRAAHKSNVVHRDLKPDNIFLCSDGPDGSEYAKVLDFGISKIRGSKTVKTMDTALLGTPQYMAPEQIAGKASDVDARTDIFALGIIAYEMLTGRMAFEGDSLPSVMYKVNFEEPAPIGELAPSIPPFAAAAIKQAIAKDREARFATIAEFVEAFTGEPMPRESQIYKTLSTPANDYESFTRGKPAPLTKPPQEAERRVSMGIGSRRRKLLLIGAAGALGLIALFFGLFWSMPPEIPPPSAAQDGTTQGNDGAAQPLFETPRQKNFAGAQRAENSARATKPTSTDTDANSNALSSEVQAKLDEVQKLLDVEDFSVAAIKATAIARDHAAAKQEAYGMLAQAYCGISNLARAQDHLQKMSQGPLWRKACSICVQKKVIAEANLCAHKN